MRFRKSSVVAGVLLLGAGLPASASAVAPTADRILINYSEINQDLSDACGVTVTGAAQGTVTWYPRPEPWDRGVILRINVNILWTFSSGRNTYRAREARVSLMRVHSDGTWIGMDAGQQSLWRSGVFKVNMTTGEVILEPRGSHPNWARICDTLKS